MKKFCIIMVTYIFISMMLFVVQVNAGEYRPLITGKYEQGQRLYLTEDEDGIGKDYIFKEGWLKFKQKLSNQSYYYIKIRYGLNDFADYNQYDSSTIDFLGNYTYQISKPLRIKTELGLRDKKYSLAKEKSYFEISTDLEIVLKPWEGDELYCRLNLQKENYIEDIKDNLLSSLTVKWDKDLRDGFSIYGQYKLSTQNYLNPESLIDKFRQSFSMGFEYKL